MTKRAVRYWVGIPLGLGLGFADHVDGSNNKAYIQAAIWTIFVLVELVNELRKYADRLVLQQLFLCGVVPVHSLFVYRTFRVMPFEHSLLVFALAYAEPWCSRSCFYASAKK